MWQNPQFFADLVTFTEEVSNGKLYFLSSVITQSTVKLENIWSYLSVTKSKELCTYCIVKNVNYCWKCGVQYLQLLGEVLYKQKIKIAMLKILEHF